MHEHLLAPFALTPQLTLANRVVMLALTRARAEIDGTPSELMIEHYAQRATAGLIISEACAVAPTGRPFLNSPGMYTHEHAVGWRRVTDAVHAAGGRMMLQINHSGRVNNLQHLARPVPPIGPSPVKIPRTSRNITVNIPRTTPYVVPRELPADEVALVVEDFRHATRLAAWAGFDGVEVHADSGYLIHQFMSTNVNHRTDAYGGSPENRARLALEVLDAVVDVNGPEFVSIKFTPGSPVQDIVEDDAAEKYSYIVDELNRRPRLAFMHLFFRGIQQNPIFHSMAESYRGTILAEGSIPPEEYADLIGSGKTHLAGFGRAFISNPDYLHRMSHGLPLSIPDPDTIYSPGAEGYTDYPFWNPEDPEGSVVVPDGPAESILVSETASMPRTGAPT